MYGRGADTWIGRFESCRAQVQSAWMKCAVGLNFAVMLYCYVLSLLQVVWCVFSFLFTSVSGLRGNHATVKRLQSPATWLPAGDGCQDLSITHPIPIAVFNHKLTRYPMLYATQSFIRVGIDSFIYIISIFRKPFRKRPFPSEVSIPAFPNSLGTPRKFNFPFFQAGLQRQPV